ncbi:MAG: lamin tail domain-containing protein, partial [Verrucomicrobia bacterium]
MPSLNQLLWTACVCMCCARPLPAQGVLMNEVMTANRNALLDENGDSSDWIELYNPDSAPVQLAGYGLSDDPAQPFKWEFRDITIEPGGFLVVFASGKDRQPGSVPPASPSAIAGLKVWLRADAVATNDPAQARASGDNSFVRRWNDQSGAANSAEQAADELQPRFVPAVAELNNRPALHFDGANDLLTLPAPPAQNSFCLIVVARTAVGHEIDPQGAAGVGGVSGQRYLLGATHGGDLNAGAGLSIGTNGVSVYEHG